MSRLWNLRTERAADGRPNAHRLTAASTQPSNIRPSRAVIVTADNGNMYTVTISDDGMFTAEYVQPPALSIPLGISGSSVEVRRNEDLTFSAMIDGEWVMITAETTVTAANGNVYAAVLSPEGIPIGVMHVAAMQEVMLGALGGTVTVKQAEDMTWWIGEMEVKDGTVYTAANGNVYTLMMDAEGAWTAMYQQVMVTVALGTQGSVELVRAEDMSWWLGSDAVGVGSEVTSASGNTYTLWYTDGVWTARFEPVSMEIAGTGLTAMTREGDNMYDVNGSTLSASGMGEVTVDGGMYRVWMQDDGSLAGARFDANIDLQTRFKRGLAVHPALSANDPETPGDETRTHLLVTGSSTTGVGMFSMGDLLGTGASSAQGSRFIDSAVESIEEVRADVSALLALETRPSTLRTILGTQWQKVLRSLDTIFGTSSGAAVASDRTSAVRLDTPRNDDILDDIEDILDALATEDAFVAATEENGGGVFADRQALSASDAVDAFNRVKWSAAVTLGTTGSTRYGTAVRQKTANAVTKLGPDESGAFSYSTMNETALTSHVVSSTGIASYSGGTEAISGKGVTYSGSMNVTVRFSANTVSGVVRDLINADGLRWQHNFADVDRIVLDDASLLRNGTWNKSGNNATVFYTAESGLLRPVDRLTNTFQGRLLGRNADAGSEANGVWSVNAADSSNYLTGGFGVTRGADATRPRPGGDDGSVSNAMLIQDINLPTMTRSDASVDTFGGTTIKDGVLQVQLQKYAWVLADHDNDPSTDDTTAYIALVDDMGTLAAGPDGIPGNADDITNPGDDDEPVLFTSKQDLATLAAKGAGVTTAANGPKHVDSVIAVLEAQRDQLVALRGLGTPSASTRTAEQAAWDKVVQAVQYDLFGGRLPVDLVGNYSSDTDLREDALNLIDQMLDALSSQDQLFAALDPNGTGVFHQYVSVPDDPATTNVNEQETEDYISYNEANREWRFDTGRDFGQFLGERSYKVHSSVGMTDYTRFGVWRRESTQSARRNDGVSTDHGGPGTFAYSLLDPTQAGAGGTPSFQPGGSARFVGETVAFQGNAPLTGTVTVDVSWAASPDMTTNPVINGANVEGSGGDALDEATNLGTMSLTISDLADATGDPLVYANTSVTTAGTPIAPTKGHEIADILFSDMTILMGLKGDRAGQMIVGTQTRTDVPTSATNTDLKDFYYGYGPLPVAETSVRYRFTDSSMGDQPRGTVAEDTTAGTPADASTLEALFVGQGGEGPLGVIGTWTLRDANVARRHIGGARLEGQGNEEVTKGAYIRGGFGAELP